MSMAAPSGKRATQAFMRACLVCLLMLAPIQRAFAIEATVRSAPSQIASFNLVDQTGRPFTNTSLEGHWTLFAIGYTSCPDVCPMTLTNLASVVEDMSSLVPPGKIPQVVFLAVDPDRDKPILKRYVSSFNPSFVGITGEASQIGVLVEGLDGFYRIISSAKHSNPEVQHSSRISIVDPEGHLVAGFSPLTDPNEAATYIANLIRARAKAGG